jgi:hypothetical protein
MVVLVTPKTGVKGPMVLLLMKSPTINKEVVSEAVVITPVEELYAVAFTPILEGIAPTHCATRLTKELAD